MSPARGGGRPGRREPPEFRRSGGDYRGGLSKAENTRDPKDRKPPSRPLGEGARRRARGTVRGGGPGWDGVHDGHRRDRGKGSPGEGEPSRGAIASPRARRTRHPTRGRGRGEQVRRGDAAALGHGRGGSVRQAIDPGEGEAPGGGAPSARGGRAEVRRVSG
jgi:hypothetical protein